MPGCPAVLNSDPPEVPVDDVPVMDLFAADFTLTDEGVVLSDGSTRVLLRLDGTDRRAMSFEVGRLERRLQVLGGRLRG